VLKATDGESDTTDNELISDCKDQMRNTLELESSDDSDNDSAVSCGDTTEGEEGDPSQLFGQDDEYSSASDREPENGEPSSGSDSDVVHGIPTLEKDGGPFPEWTLDPCSDSDNVNDCDSRDKILEFLNLYDPEDVEHPPKRPHKQSTIYDVFNSGFLEEGQAKWAAQKLKESIYRSKFNRYKISGSRH
jgi:hypothetical protein